LTDEMKEAARAEWERKSAERKSDPNAKFGPGIPVL
jgi:hypothetical protein